MSRPYEKVVRFEDPISQIIDSPTHDLPESPDAVRTVKIFVDNHSNWRLEPTSNSPYMDSGFIIEPPAPILPEKMQQSVGVYAGETPSTIIRGVLAFQLPPNLDRNTTLLMGFEMGLSWECFERVKIWDMSKPEALLKDEVPLFKNWNSFATFQPLWEPKPLTLSGFIESVRIDSEAKIVFTIR